MKKALFSLSAVVVLIIPGLASAETFNWSYVGSGIDASGQLTADPTGLPAGEFLITSFTGTRNGNPIFNFVSTTCGTPGCDTADASGTTADNLLFAPASGIGQIKDGVIFSTTDGTFNIWYNDGSYGGSAGDYEYVEGGGIPGAEIRFEAGVSPTPEPATFVLAGAALSGLALRRRRVTA